MLYGNFNVLEIYCVLKSVMERSKGLELEVLVSCMNQKDYSLVKKLNLQTDGVIVNQTDKNSYTEINVKNNTFKFISSNQRGLTVSRNLALSYASKDICILCDDDVYYYPDYKRKILKAFEELPDADIIIFDIDRINYRGNAKLMKKVKRAHPYKSYGSVRIAFRRQSIERNNIKFDVNFGSGSVYSSGEETIFLNDARKKRLNIYEYPTVIARVDFQESTWRQGYDEKFFYDKGALLANAYPSLKYLFIFYYLKTLRKYTSLTDVEIIKWLLKGIKGFRLLSSFDNFNKTSKITENNTRKFEG